ncbi:MAG: carbohydrate kinase family protein [Candidatus Micrarchaeota archaeon]
MDLVTMGHILFDIRCYVKEFPVPDKTSFTYSEIETSLGGSAANAACAAAKLGIKAGFTGNIGGDAEGGQLIQYLLKAGVDIARLRLVDGKTGKAIVIVNAESDVEVVEMRGVNEPFGKVDPTYIADAKYLLMTGTSLDALEIASRYAKENNVKTIFDPGRAKSRDGLKRLAQIIKNSDFIIINRAELAMLTGEKTVDKGIEKVQRENDEITCVIKGGGSPVVVKGSENFESEPFKVKPVDTIGAGDSFCAGFITGLVEHKSLQHSVMLANAVAAAKVERKGAHNVPGRDEIKKRFKI